MQYECTQHKFFLESYYSPLHFVLLLSWVELIECCCALQRDTLCSEHGLAQYWDCAAFVTSLGWFLLDFRLKYMLTNCKTLASL